MSALFVVMGVAGSGKSLIGASLAHSLGVDFVDGDDYHSAENIERMAAGIPLTDDDRAAWLGTLAEKIREARNSGAGIVVACSALKRRYRDILRTGAPELQIVFLNGTRTLIAERLAARAGHFMPPSLLDSQLSTLQEPTADEDVLVCDIAKSPEEIVADIVARASA